MSTSHAGWQPQEQGLRDLLTAIDQSRASDNQIQKQVKEKFDLFNQAPDFNNYLVYVLANPIQGVQVNARAVAGYLLVNNLRSRFPSFPAATIAYIKPSLIQALQDPSPEVRRSASNTFSWFTRQLVPENYPDGLQQLLQLITAGNADVQETALSTVAKLCQDAPKALERAQLNGQPFLNFLVPLLLQRMDSEDVKLRTHALTSLVPFIEPETNLPPNALGVHIDHFIASLFKRASDPSSAVRKQVCTAMVALLSCRPLKLQPEINGVVDYILHCTQDQDKDLALEACEFWLTFAEDADLHSLLAPFVSRVAPILLDCTIYEEEELLSLGAYDDDDDAAVADKPQDIKPTFYEAKVHAQSASQQPQASTSKARGTTPTPNEAEEEDDEDDDLLSDDEDYSEWTLRKCAAAALDVMATAFEENLLVILMPHLKQKLESTDWLQRESGILTLGAMAEGCIGHLSDHLPQLIPFFLQSLSDSKPLVRSIASWTIGRYAAWLITDESTPEHKQQFFVPALEGLLRTLLDRNKKVQEAGCSAFATLEEEAGPALEPFLQPILQTLVYAFGKYQQKNLLILYDAIGTLADAVGESLNQKELTDLLMPPLFNKWQSLEDDDEDVVPLLECMSSVVIAVSRGFLPYSQVVFERCTRIIQTSLMHYQQWQNNSLLHDEPDKTFLVVALDLLSGLTQGLNTAIRPLYQATNVQFFQILMYCLQFPDLAVRQSAYALLGDCAISVFDDLRPYVPQIMPILTTQIEAEPKAEAVSVCNNAVWAAGELALKLGTDTAPYINDLMARLIPVLLSPKTAKSLVENSAVTIGRLGFVCPETVAPHLELFMRHWCSSLAEIKDNEEKDSAFRGICMVIQANPNGLVKNFQFFLNAIARWQKPSPELNQMFAAILTGFKNMMGAQWPAMMQSMPQPIQVRITERYGV